MATKKGEARPRPVEADQVLFHQRVCLCLFEALPRLWSKIIPVAWPECKVARGKVASGTKCTTPRRPPHTGPPEKTVPILATAGLHRRPRRGLGPLHDK
eukprot:CAMPEP_0180479904 /NCGR_PEP_ID=MMETSP1036_2-20121128/33543_1 /TAXON_ID=632150 /ORGANISM="Azadinium spinosum, Strain 3D9" /LENGTH=98 /DNA_ID=CAMNT_0022487487 /DNA_START=381 /DNA_END=677 /DNA_ORIENTATION=-